MGHQRFFHLTGIDVFAAADDHVFQPVHDEEHPVFILVRQVFRMQPAVAQRVGRFFRAVPVTDHKVMPLHAEFPHFAHRDLVEVFVHQLHRNVGKRFPDGALFRFVPAAAGHHRRRFRQTVAFMHMLAEFFRESIVQVAGQGGAAADKVAEVRQVFRLRPFHEHLVHGRHAEHGVDLIFFDQVHGLAELVRLLHHHGRAQVQVHHDRAVPAEAVIHGQHAQTHVVFADRDDGHEIFRIVHHISLAQHRPFGPPGGAGGINDNGRIRFLHIVFDEFRALRRRHLVKGDLL